jgi:hypothetical protein
MARNLAIRSIGFWWVFPGSILIMAVCAGAYAAIIMMLATLLGKNPGAILERTLTNLSKLANIECER